MTFIHAADLHFRAKGDEADYGLSVAAELIDMAGREGNGILLLSGDVFDSNADFMALFPKLRALADKENGLKELLVIAGNHDKLRSDRSPASLDAGKKIRLAWDAPLVRRVAAGDGDIEFVLVPYGVEIPHDLPGPEIPRVVAAHGSLPELNWIGLGEEGEKNESVLDGSRILSLSPAYVALGHIHDGRAGNLGDAVAAYPGSATPWRKGESGPRRALRVELRPGTKAGLKQLDIESAGRYVSIVLRLSLDENDILGKASDEAIKSVGPRDWVDVDLRGIVRTETDALKTEDALNRAWKGRIRKLTIARDELVLLERAEDAPAAADFFHAWEGARAKMEELHGETVALKALEIGLSRIAKTRGGRP